MASGPVLRVGLYGGAFDPPHCTHVALAEAAIAQLNLDVLHVVPTGHAWHKQRSLSDAQHRLAMCALAFAGVPRAVVDARETQRSGPSYTIDTVLELQQAYPAAHVFLVMGEDQARALGSWHRSEELQRAATICVALRPDSSGDAGPSASNKSVTALPFQAVHMPPSTVSATHIRHQIARGHHVVPLVFESVARYIDQHHLYQSA